MQVAANGISAPLIPEIFATAANGREVPHCRPR